MWKKIKECLNNIREIVWPLLDPLVEEDEVQINENDLKWDDDELGVILEYVNKYYESEEIRNKEIESKSTIFIGTFSVATAVLISLTKDLVLNDTNTYSLTRLILVVLMTLSIIYLCRAIWFSIKALERQKYHVLGFPQYMFEQGEKRKKLIVSLYNCTRKNSRTINLKVDNMTMAQEYFKRALMIVALFSIFVMFKYIFQYYKTLIGDINKTLSSIIVSNNILILIVLSIIILFTLVCSLFYKLSKIQK